MRKASIYSLIFAAVLLLAASAVPEELSPPEENFEYLWRTLDRNYAIFGPKHVDWAALYAVYRPRVTPLTSDDELFEIMSDMLGHLNDNHLLLFSEDPGRFYCAGYLSQVFSGNGFHVLEDLKSRRPVPETYFQAGLEESENGVFAHGWVNRRTGYIHFNQFGDVRGSQTAIDDIIAEFRHAQAIIVDVRRNVGGDDRVGKVIADRFADKKRLYMTTQIRNGDGHADFTAKKYWHVEPSGPLQFTGPVILITDRTSISAAENFALAMRVLPHVTVIGDFTSGCFADMYMDELPNGWGFSVSYKLFLDHTGFCWEGIGVPPDLRVYEDPSNMDAGKDSALQLAVALIESGSISLQDESKSAEAARESLVAELRREASEKGMGAAVNLLRRLESKGLEGHYADFDEIMALGNDLMNSGNVEESIAIFNLLAREFPRMPNAFSALGRAHLRSGQVDLAVTQYDNALAANRRSYPWEITDYRRVQLARVICAEGYDAMAEIYRNLRVEGADDFDENVLNALGYELLFAGKTQEAIDVFTLNVETYPDYANGYDSLAEAYMESGHKEMAIENYRKSLAIDPGNANAREMLGRLGAE